MTSEDDSLDSNGSFVIPPLSNAEEMQLSQSGPDENATREAIQLGGGLSEEELKRKAINREHIRGKTSKIISK